MHDIMWKISAGLRDGDEETLFEGLNKEINERFSSILDGFNNDEKYVKMFDEMEKEMIKHMDDEDMKANI